MTRSTARFLVPSEKIGFAVACVVVFQLSLAVAGLGADSEQSSYSIRADDGSLVANQRVVELARAVEQLSDVVKIGGGDGSIAIAEFYDLNCPYCRRAAGDIADLIRKNRDLKVILVSFPVLSIVSIEAARVELAVSRLVAPERFHDFHRKLYAGRGVVDGAHTFAAARELGLDPEHS